MPGYEPFLLCDFHVHTKWSDGRLSIREVVDLYGCEAGRTHTSSRSTSRSTSARINRPTPFCVRFAGRAHCTCYLWDHREELAHLVDVWEAANRDDLFPVLFRNGSWAA